MSRHSSRNSGGGGGGRSFVVPFIGSSSSGGGDNDDVKRNSNGAGESPCSASAYDPSTVDAYDPLAAGDEDDEGDVRTSYAQAVAEGLRAKAAARQATLGSAALRTDGALSLSSSSPSSSAAAAAAQGSVDPSQFVEFRQGGSLRTT